MSVEEFAEIWGTPHDGTSLVESASLCALIADWRKRGERIAELEDLLKWLGDPGD